MISRFNYKPLPLRDSSHDDDNIEYDYTKKMRVLSSQKDGSIDKYVEESFFEEKKSSWTDFIFSFNLGSVSEQVLNHLTKGTPLVTAHTLPAGDYTKLEQGARIVQEMKSKGITLDMILDAYTNQEKEAVVEKQPEQ